MNVKKIKRMTKPLLFILMFGLLMAACSPRDTQTPLVDETTPTEQMVNTQTVVIMEPKATVTATRSAYLEVSPTAMQETQLKFLHPWVGPNAKAISALVNEFNRSNEWGVTVEAASVGGDGVLYEQVRQMLSGGSMPDIVAINPYYAQQLDGDYFWMDITPYLQDAEWGIRDDTLNAIPKVYFEQSQVGERLMGLPFGMSATALYYNLTWARELGFDEIPTTPEALEAQACAAADALLLDADYENNGTGGIPIYASSDNVIAWYAAFGGMLTPETAVASFNNQAASDSFDYIKTMFDESCAWNPRLPSPYDYFARRLALVYPGSLKTFEEQKGAMERSGNTDEWTMIPFPTTDGQGTFLVDGYVLVISVAKPETQLASWLFTRWLSSPAAQQVFANASYLWPLQSEVAMMMDEMAQRAPQWDDMMGSLELAQSAPAYPAWVMDRMVLEDAFYQYLFGYQSVLTDILTSLDATILEMSEGVHAP